MRSAQRRRRRPSCGTRDALAVCAVVVLALNLDRLLEGGGGGGGAAGAAAAAGAAGAGAAAADDAAAGAAAAAVALAAHAGLALCDFFGRFSGRKSSIGGGAVALRSRGPTSPAGSRRG